jgi:hypothetical protein
MPWQQGGDNGIDGYLLSHGKIAKSVSVSASIVSIYAMGATSLGITSWRLDEKWNDETLQRIFFKTKTKTKTKGDIIPSGSVVQQGLRPKMMMLISVD